MGAGASPARCRWPPQERAPLPPRSRGILSVPPGLAPCSCSCIARSRQAGRQAVCARDASSWGLQEGSLCTGRELGNPPAPHRSAAAAMAFWPSAACVSMERGKDIASTVFRRECGLEEGVGGAAARRLVGTGGRGFCMRRYSCAVPLEAVQRGREVARAAGVAGRSATCIGASPNPVLAIKESALTMRESKGSYEAHDTSWLLLTRSSILTRILDFAERGGGQPPFINC